MESKLGKNSVLPTLTSLDYFMEPCRNILKAREQACPGYCRRVKDFTIGRVGYGQIKFSGETDVRGLDLDSIVEFTKNKVDVYKEEAKPAPGYGLNKSAEVTLVIHTNLVEKYDILDVLDILEAELRRVATAQGADFISFDPNTREWRFSVNHFSRFGLTLDREEEDEEEEEEEEMDEVMEEHEEGWLTHSLPAHLGLDPTKLKELKNVMCFDEEEEGMKKERAFIIKTGERVGPTSRRRSPVPLVEYGGGSGFGDTMRLSQQHDKVKTTFSKVHGDGFRSNSRGVNLFSETRSRNVVDAGLFMGRSFRVGWGPGGVLVRPRSPGASIGLERVAIDRVVRDEYGEIKEELVESCFVRPLQLHREHVGRRVVGVEIDSRKLNLREASADPHSLSEICGGYIDIAAGRSESWSVVHEITTWGLIDVLFSPDDGSPTSLLVRRAEFSRWLKESVGEMGSSHELGRILSLLTSRRIEEAVEAAAARGDVRLACLLSQAGGFPANRGEIGRQLRLWRDNMLDFDLLENGLVRVLELLAGDVHTALEGMDVDWMRFLGVFLWYRSAPDVDLRRAFDEYHRLVIEGRAPHPSPFYGEGAGGRFDIVYHLMLLHAAGEEGGRGFGYLKEMFSASASTDDPFDYHMIWHQRSVLEAVGVIQSDGLHVLDVSMVSQLLCLGQCHWAIYVALHMCRRAGFPYLHASLIREILFQYCETWSSSEDQYLFIESLGVPSEWLHESMAVYYDYHGDLPKAMEHYIGCSNWQRAHSIFLTCVSHSLFLKGEEKEIMRIVTEMEKHKSEIENWELGAGLYSSFFFLKESLHDPDDATLTSLEQVCREFFEAIKESLRVFDEKLPLGVRVAYGKMAGEVCERVVVFSTSNSSGGGGFDLEALLSAPLPNNISSLLFHHHSLPSFSSFLSHLSLPPL